MSIADAAFKQELKLNSSPKNIVLVEPFIEEFLCKHEIRDDVYGNMLVAVTEAVNNAIIHGNKSSSGKIVKISLKCLNNTIICIVQDEGNGFDFINLPDPTSPKYIEMEGGRGIFLMKNLSDLVIFSNDGSTVEIQFKI